MSAFDIDANKRDQLVKRYWESFARTSWPIFQTLTAEQRSNEYSTQNRLLDEYAEILPFVPVGRCPFTGDILEYVLDPLGLDGMWWCPNVLAKYPEPHASQHFRTLLGAIDFHGRIPAEAKVHREVRPGPGVPFVVPQMLTIPGMRAVIAQVDLALGDTGYAISYFSEGPVHGGYLHQPWGRNAYQVFDADGNYEAWSTSSEAWDYALGPWLDRELLLWIEPGDAKLVLHKGKPCPYENLAGTRAPQEISEGTIYLLTSPSGGPVDVLD